MKIFNLFVFLFFVNLVSGAHYIVGQVNDAVDTTPANGRTVVLWNPSIGINDNLTDIIGPSGNSGADNIYLFDCELLSNGCVVGDALKVTVVNEGDGYITENGNVVVTGSGYDLVSELTLSKEINILELETDDYFSNPYAEIDLTPLNLTFVNCSGYARGNNLDSTVSNVTSELYHTSSFYGDFDDKNKHYTNNSCFYDTSYGNGDEVYFRCGFNMEYYSEAGNWSCYAKVTNNAAQEGYDINRTRVNSLLAVEINSNINYGILNSTSVSSENTLNISNVGNIKINLSLQGYARTPGDGYSMNCTNGRNISIAYQKYNLTGSNPGDLSLSEMELKYSNLTSSPITKKYGLNNRQNDLTNDAINSSYWRMYLPRENLLGNCSGKIVIGATSASE